MTTGLFTVSAQTQIVDWSYSLSQTKNSEQLSPWERLIDNFAINFPHNSVQVQHQLNTLLKDPYHTTHALKNMSPYLPWLLEEIEKKNLPAELLVIPLIESCYEPHVTSHYGASGLWQIMPITADHMKLQSIFGFEPRHDLALSTQAALSFLQELHRTFGSWVLALAAYNAGPARVKNALKKTKYRHDMDFFKLDLPEQTREYVPKVLAFSQLIREHKTHQIVLPSHPDPLVKLQISKPCDFTTLALAFDCPVAVLNKFNHQYPLKAIPAGSSYNVFIPYSYAAKQKNNFDKNIRSFQEKPYYVVKKGDNLLKIASKFMVSANDLMVHNDLSSTSLYPGQKIKVSAAGMHVIEPIEYIVRPGDCLSKIARRFHVSTSEIIKSNHLNSTKIQSGQKLLIAPQPFLESSRQKS